MEWHYLNGDYFNLDIVAINTNKIWSILYTSYVKLAMGSLHPQIYLGPRVLLPMKPEIALWTHHKAASIA